MWMRVCKKIICLFAALCMVFPMAAIGEELTIESALPIIQQIQLSPIEKIKEIIYSTWELYYKTAPMGTGYCWYAVENFIDEKNLSHEVHLEFLYEHSRSISITVVYPTDKSALLILVESSGKEPSLELIAKYFRMGLYAYEIQDEDNENYKIQLTTDVK